MANGPLHYQKYSAILNRMQFLRENQGAAVQAVTASICDALFKDRRVLWLTSGGSNVQTETTIMQQLRNHCGDKLEGLAVMPMDERYGGPGHADSNVQALRANGFDPGAATLIDVLMHDLPFEETVHFYNEVAATALANAAVVIGQFGLGTDAHVAGILPGSPATEADESTVAGYKWEDYTRLTLTPKALLSVTTAYVLAYGAGKKTALNRLRKNKEAISELPATLLYSIPEVYVYNDQIEEKET
jgi:6-phosphogluconolactonase/glucosamine-6-phosphate isomerase/deaminase